VYIDNNERVSMKVHGSCHCGQIRFSAEVDPALTSICHCHDCQRLTGTAYRVSVPAREGSLQMLAGAPQVYVKVAQSGSRRAQAFCGTCGSPLFTYDADNPTAYGLRVGVLDERAQLKPIWQKWCSSALSWSQDISGLERAQGNARHS
jgi:hypothetical protein